MTNEEATRILKVAIEDSKEHISFCFDSRGIGALDLAIKALEQTDKIEDSNFSTEQYKADLRGAYDCGYNCGYADAMSDIAESEE